MGWLKKVKQAEKNAHKEAEQKVEEFRLKVSQLGREYGMAIVPVMEKYGLALEIQVLQKKDDNVEVLQNMKDGTPSDIEKGHAEIEALSKKM